LKIENVVSISTPFNNQVTEIDVHREEISYIVSEEFSEQFTAFAFINFKKTPQKCPACRVCHQEANLLRNKGQLWKEKIHSEDTTCIPSFEDQTRSSRLPDRKS
jgi:hypothetical protein